MDSVRRAQPSRLMIVADGPRPERRDEGALCRAARSAALDVDWPCDVTTDFAEQNLGCRDRVRSGLDWVFDQVGRAILLEDDCVPHPDFFTFCGDALDRYADDPRVGAITGDNFQDGHRRGDAVLYFSKYLHVWGWATWADRWKAFRSATGDEAGWVVEGSWAVAHPDRAERAYWTRRLRGVVDASNDTWDYDWVAYCWSRGWLTVTPAANLVENIGFGADATHTTAAAAVPAAAGLPEGVQPSEVVPDIVADRYTFEHHYGGAEFRARRRPLGFVRWALDRRRAAR